MDILVVLVPPALYTDANLFSLLTCRMVNLSLRYGISGASAYGYVVFGLLLGRLFHRYAEGYRFGQLGCELADRHGFTAYEAKIYVAAGVNAFWPLSAANTSCGPSPSVARRSCENST